MKQSTSATWLRIPVTTFLLTSLLGTSALAATLGVPLQEIGIPATDLLHRGQPIDRDDAMNLHRSGTDISTLDPSDSDAWTNQALPLSNAQEWNYPADGATVSFDSYMDATERVMRSRIIDGQGANGRPFQLLISLKAHSAMATAALLRRLGYPIASPKRYTSLTVRFDSPAARDEFLDTMADRNQACRGRWLKYEGQNADEIAKIAKDPCIKSELVKLGNSNEVTLQDIVLEPGQIDTWMFHWGIMKAPLLKGRRALRALIAPVVLADINESINLFSWEIAKVLTNTLILTHTYADQYQEASYTDIKWMARKIAHLTRSELTNIVKAGEYPADIEALLVEKLVARQKQLAQIFNIQPSGVSFQFNSKISVGGVKEGKLLKEWYPGYSLRFAYEDPESPLRTDELAKYLQIEGISAGIGKLIEQVNKHLQLSTVSDVAQNHVKGLQQACMQEFQQKGFCSRPVGLWGGPVAGVGVQADRSVITGTYYGGESRVQLVDNVGVSANVGLFLTKDGLPSLGGIPISAGLFSNLSFSRNYVHVRPLVNMTDATRDNWGNIYVPKFMQNLASKLDIELSNDPEIVKPENFFEELKEGEMFIITDSVGVGAQAQVNLPLAGILDSGIMGVSPSLSVSAGTQRAIIRRTTVMRTKDGLQVYLQRINSNAFNFGLDFNFWIKVFSFTQTTKKGYASTKAFLLGSEIAEEKRRPLATALKAILKSNNSEMLEGEFGYYALNHQMTSKIEQGRFLRWQWFGLDESHTVKIQPPVDPQGRYNPAEKERTLFSHRILRTNGSNDAALFNDVIAKYAPGWSVLPTAGANPANSFLGKGQWAIWSGEAELTSWNPSGIVTSVEHHWGGWKLGKEAFFKIIEGIEAKVKPLNLDRPIIRREEFQTMKELQFYEITSKLLIYEAGMKTLMDHLIDPRASNETVHARLVKIETGGTKDGEKKFSSYCWQNKAPDMAPTFHTLFNPILELYANSGGGMGGDRTKNTDQVWFQKDKWGEQDTFKDRNFYCVKPWMRWVMDNRTKMPTDRKKQIVWTTQFIRTMESQLPLEKVLGVIGKQNYFYQVRVSGFRTNDSNGDTEYTSDSIGTFNETEGAGVFSDFASKYGITQHELSARYLSEGF